MDWPLGAKCCAKHCPNEPSRMETPAPPKEAFSQTRPLAQRWREPCPWPHSQGPASSARFLSQTLHSQVACLSRRQGRGRPRGWSGLGMLCHGVFLQRSAQPGRGQVLRPSSSWARGLGPRATGDSKGLQGRHHRCGPFSHQRAAQSTGARGPCFWNGVSVLDSDYDSVLV